MSPPRSSRTSPDGGLRSNPEAPRLSALALTHPRLTLTLCWVLALVAAPGVLRLELDTDGAALVPSDAPEVLLDAEVAERFDLRDPVAVVLEVEAEDDAHGIWTPGRLEHLATLSAELAQLDGVGVEYVASLATERSDRVLPGTLDFRPWLEPLPTDLASAERLRDDVLEVDIYRGTLLASTLPVEAAAILVGTPPGVDRRAFLRSVRSVLDSGADERTGTGLRAMLAGAPVAEATLGDHLLRDLTRLIPACIALLALVFFLAFRNRVATLLPLCEVGFALLTTFGTLGWIGVPVYLSMAVLPVVLCAVGVADEVHVFGAWLRTRGSSPELSPRERALTAMGAMGRPVTATSITTAVGFLAFATSPLAPVRAFGLAMALGVGLCLAWTLCVMPVLLVRFDRELAGGPAPERLARTGERFAGFASATSTRPARVIAAALVLFTLLPLGARHLVVQDSWIDSFDPKSEVARSIRRVNELFGGAHLLRVAIEAEPVDARGELARSELQTYTARLPLRPGRSPEALVGCELGVRGAGTNAEFVWASVRTATWEGDGTRLEFDRSGPDPARWIPSSARSVEWQLSSRERLLDPACLALLADLERYLESFDATEIGRVVGPYEHMTTMNFMLGNRRPGSRVAPESRERARHVVGHYLRVRGERARDRLFQDDARAALLTAFLPAANFRTTRDIFDAIDGFEAAHLAPHGLSVSLAGDVPRSQAMIAAIVRTELLSLGAGLLLVFLAASALLRSLTLGLLCSLPAGIAVLATFSFMGAMEIPLGVATSMFAAMTLGIGVDYAIHMASAAQRARASGRSNHDAAVHAAREAGPVVLFDAVALGAAFGLLTLSSVPTNARLGILMVVGLFTCALVSLVLLPPLLARRST